MAERFMTSEDLVDEDPVAFLSAVRALELDKVRRRTRVHRPTVIDYSPGHDDTADLVPPGAISVFVAPRGSDLLSEVRAAYGKNDSAAVSAVTERAVEAVQDRQRLTFMQAAQDLVAGRPYGDLRYRGKTIAECLGLVDGIPFGVLPLAYVGGDLDPDAFSFVEYVPTGSPDEDLEVVLVARPPHLSEAEQEVLALERRRFGEELAYDEILINPGGRAAITLTLVVVAVFVVAVHTPTLTGRLSARTVQERFARASALSEAKVKALGSAATVGDLMAARVDVLSRSY